MTSILGGLTVQYELGTGPTDCITLPASSNDIAKYRLTPNTTLHIRDLKISGGIGGGGEAVNGGQYWGKDCIYSTIMYVLYRVLA